MVFETQNLFISIEDEHCVQIKDKRLLTWVFQELMQIAISEKQVDDDKKPFYIVSNTVHINIKGHIWCLDINVCLQCVNTTTLQ